MNYKICGYNTSNVYLCLHFNEQVLLLQQPDLPQYLTSSNCLQIQLFVVHPAWFSPLSLPFTALLRPPRHAVRSFVRSFSARG